MASNPRLDWIDDFWEREILPSLAEYIRIPNKSVLFDPDWDEHGFMAEAVRHVTEWVDAQAVPGLTGTVHELEGRTPVILLSIDGGAPGNVLIYGHLDKQPEFEGWLDHLGPWEPVLENERLYGRGGADDGYAIYSAIAAIKALQHDCAAFGQLSVLIECSEESGSPDLASYMEALADEIGRPDLVVALDSTAGNYEQLWVTTSLRGMITGELGIRVLHEGAHSGAAGGIVPSSFRLLRQLMSRIEDEHTGEILPDFLQAQMPAMRDAEAARAGEVLGDDFKTMFTYTGTSGPQSSDPKQVVIDNSWAASIEITGMDGVPPISQAGNVLRPFTKVKFALRLPPTVKVAEAEAGLRDLLLGNPPNGVEVTLDLDTSSPGWHAPLTDADLEASLQTASDAHFGAPAIAIGCGGSIPFMEFLANSFPDAQFVVTGVLGPHSNAHGPNEFLHVPTAKKLTACIADVLSRFGS